MLSRSVILCNGDVEVFSIDNCFVVASGQLLIHSSSAGNVVVGLDRIQMLNVESSVVVGRGRVERREDVGSIVRTEDGEYFRNWRMFSRADTGAELVSVFGLVWVSAVTPASPFDRAGVRVGDLLTRVDDTSVRSNPVALRLLCRASVGSGDADLTLVRDGQIIRIVAALQSWE